MARKIIVSARGKKIDFDALKASTPNARSVGTRRESESVPNKKQNQLKVVPVKISKLSLPSPAPRPTNMESSEEIEQEVDAIVEEIDIFVEGKSHGKKKKPE